MIRWLFLLLLACGPALAVGNPADQLPDATQEERARTIGRELRCMVCQNQSIEDSEADLARDLRRVVREQVSAGKSDAAVTDFVHQRYGDFVLLRPPFKLSTALLWATPAVALRGGRLLIRGMRRRQVPDAALGATSETAPEMAKELSPLERARLAKLAGGTPE